MFTKPHYRQILARKVTKGMRVYSRMLHEAFTVERIEALSGGRLVFISGCFHYRVLTQSLVWVETKPRRLA